MDIFKFDIRVGTGKLHIGEVPEAANTQIDQTGSGVLSNMLRNGQHHHIHLVFLQVRIQIVHRVDGHTVDRGADDGRRDVEGSVHREAGVRKAEVLQQRMTQITNADHHQVVVVINAQNVADFRAEFFHIVSIALLAELAEAAEVLTDLRGGDVHLLTQRVGGDADDAAIAQIGQLTVVSGKTPDDGIRDVFFFHTVYSWEIDMSLALVYRKVGDLSIFLTIFL